MKGTVTHFNQRTAFACVQIAPGDFTVIELLGDEVEIGDILEGDLEALGGETLTNLTQGYTVEVFIQGIHCSPAAARRLLA